MKTFGRPAARPPCPRATATAPPARFAIAPSPLPIAPHRTPRHLPGRTAPGAACVLSVTPLPRPGRYPTRPPREHHIQRPIPPPAPTSHPPLPALPPCDRYRTSCPLCHCAVPAPHRAASYATPPSRANGARRSLRTLRNPIAAAGPFSNPTTTGDTHATPCTRQRPALHPRPVRLQHRRRRTGVVAARDRRPVAACRGRNRVGRHAGQGLRGRLPPAGRGV